MKKDGMTPDMITFSNLISGFAQKGNMDACLNFMQEMKESNIKIDETTFNIVIEGYMKIGEITASREYRLNKYSILLV